MISVGVSKDNVAEYVKLGVVGVVLGSASLDQQLSKGGHDGLVRYVRSLVKLVDEALGVSC